MSSTTSSEIFNRIRHDIGSYDVVLYMKGSPAFPQDGFSAAVAQILDTLGVAYKDFDVLVDSGLRQAIKDYSNWPSTPQLYVKGEFIWGSDIVREMYQSGELQALFKSKGLL